MAKSFSVTFNVLGNVDPSLLSALQAAQNRIKGLQNLSRSVNQKAIANAQKLANLQNQHAQVKGYNDLRQAIKDTAQQRAAELTNANRLNAQRNVEVKTLATMRTSLKELQRVQTRLKNNAQQQRGGVDLARADLKAAKQSGDLTAIKAAQDALIRQQESARRAREEVQKINDALKQGRAELKAQQAAVRNVDAAFNTSSQAANKLQAQLANQTNQLRQFQAQGLSGNLAGQEAQLRAQIQQTTAALNQEIAALERRNQIHTNFQNASQNLAYAYGNFQNSLQTAQTLMNPFADAAENAMTFEKSMDRLRSLTQMRNIRAGNLAQVEEEMASMTATIKNLGATTEFTRNEIAGAANFYGMSGWTAKQINAMLPATTDLASISQLSMGRVADMLSDDMTAFGIKAGETYRLTGGKVVDGAKYFADAVAYATTQSNMDLSTFHESWKYNAPTAHAMNLSLGESIAQNMVASSAGIKGSMAGTSFRQFWVRLAAPPKTAQKSLEEMGLAASDATKKVMETQAAMQEAGVDMNSDLFTKIEQLERYYQTLSGDARTGWLKNLTGQTALSGVQSLFDTGKLAEAKRYAQEIDSGWVQGWSADVAAVMRDNTKTSIDYLTSALDALQGNAGDALLPAIRGAAEAFTPLVASAAEFIAQNPALVQAAAAIAAALSAATVAIAGFSLAMAGVRFAQAGWATAGLVFSDLSAKIATASAALRGLSLASIGSSISAGVAAASSAFSALGASIMTAARAALAFVFTPVGAVLTAIALAAVYAYQNWDRIAPVIDQLSNAFSGILMPAIENAKNALATFAAAINLDGVAAVIGNIANAIGGGLVGVIIGAAGVIGSVISAIVVGLAGLVETIATLGAGLAETFSKMTSGDFSGAFESLKATASSSAEAFKNSWVNAFEAVKGGISATNDAINSYVQPQPQISGGGVGAIQAQIEAAQIDTTAAQGQVDALGAAASTAAMNMQGVQNIGMEFQNASTNIQSVSTAATTASTSFQTSGEMATAAGSQFQMAGDAAANSVGGLMAMVDGASAVAGALQAKAGEIAAIVITQPQVNYVPINIPVGAGAVAANAAGGIYPKGEFLTTFAEKSPEAAIPLDGSTRAINLWQETGRLLGVMPDNQPPLITTPTFNTPSYESTSPINITVNVTVNGNAPPQEFVPEIKKSLAEALAELQHEQRRRSFA